MKVPPPCRTHRVRYLGEALAEAKRRAHPEPDFDHANAWATEAERIRAQLATGETEQVPFLDYSAASAGRAIPATVSAAAIIAPTSSL